MGKKKGRVQKHATRANSAREGSDAEESESGDLSGTSSEKQRLFDTRAELREAKAGCAAKGEPKVEEGADHALHLPPFHHPQALARICRTHQHPTDPPD